jgi:hypothetical protein
LYSDPIIREKDRRIEVFALPRAHPVGVHRTSSDMQILPVDLTAIPVPKQAFTRSWRLFNKPTLGGIRDEPLNRSQETAVSLTEKRLRQPIA